MGALLLAGLTGLIYGVSDLLGGVAARRAGAVAVSVASHLAGAGVLVVAALVMPGTHSFSDAAWGAAAGASGAGGVLLYYMALAHGRMAQVAPVTMTTATVVPVAAGTFLGEVPSPLAMVGIIVALVAVLLVARPAVPRSRYQPRHLRQLPSHRYRPRHLQLSSTPTTEAPAEISTTPEVTEVTSQPRGRMVRSPVRPATLSVTPTYSVLTAHHRPLVTALVAGLGLGGFYALMQFCGTEAGVRPLLWARAAALWLLVGAMLRVRHQPPWPQRSTLPTALVAGGLEGVANVAYVIACQLAWRTGALSLVAVLTALTPVWTAILAWGWLREPLGLLQGVGLALAGLAIGLITLG